MPTNQTYARAGGAALSSVPLRRLLRAGLASGVSVAALTVAGAVSAAPDKCLGPGSATVTCSGNHSFGITLGAVGVDTSKATVVQVTDLSQPINSTAEGILWTIGTEDIDRKLLVYSGPVTGATGGIRLIRDRQYSSKKSLQAFIYTDVTARGGTYGAVSLNFTGHDGSNGSGDGNHGNNGSPVRGQVLTFGSTGDDRTGRITATGAGNPGIGIVHAGGKGGSGSNGTWYAGGTGGGGGSSSDSTVWLMAPWAITTEGSGAAGISIDHSGGHGGKAGSGSGGGGGHGGGGGDGGTALIGNGSDTPVSIRTLGAGSDHAPGISVVLRGGDGGKGGSSDLSGGGGGGKGGWGGTIEVTGEDGEAGSFDILTEGMFSDGMHLISSGGIGGDAGHGGVFVAGGDGGSSGAAGAITANLAGSIVTKGGGAYGIRAHSIAGHGGDAATGWSLFRTEGGSAGNGGTVQIHSAATILTEGDGGTGISALSTGGGGGHGGTSFAVFFSQGGPGGNGGLGGKVEIDNSGTITTMGHSAAGISAQSIGGVGGNGGATGGLVALGGRGGSSSHGGDVVVTTTGAIETGGGRTDDAAGSDSDCATGCSPGIIAQSIGGGGGVVGGTADAGSVGGLVVSLGGTGGGGGNGGAVTVGMQAPVTTHLRASDAILAQSIGGGGGKGGGAVSFSAGMGAAVGGSGGSGGKGGAVQFTASDAASAVTTRGDGSGGVVLQSIGGGGGRGNFAVSATVGVAMSAAVAVGGSGGNGGNGGAVTYKWTADARPILTYGLNAPGVTAQSIGGGGGSGGWTAAVALSAGLADFNGSVSVSVGGSGGKGGHADTVWLENAAAITTEGDHSRGIYAQSIGGGGGDALFSAAASASAGDSVNIAVAVGGHGGPGGTGETVHVENAGAITTRGASAHGIDAQSIGGTGGNGATTVSGTLQGDVSTGLSLGGAGGSGNEGGEVYVHNAAGITVEGDKAMGISAQSIGGGGGRGGVAINGQILISKAKTVALQFGGAKGGSGGKGNVGGIVTVDNWGDISTGGEALSETAKDNAHAILAQSIGGGGGHGGLAGSFSIGSNRSDEAPELNVQVAVGGDGGSGSRSGTVKVQNHAALTTWAGQSHGIFAQSVGGSGGSGAAGYSASAEALSSVESSTVNADFAVGGKGGSGGDGAIVSVTNAGGIQTNGQAHSVGILAQSIGGGGGSGGSAHAMNWNLIYKSPSDDAPSSEGFNASLNVRVGGDSGAGGDGKSVSVSNTGTIRTTGHDSPGIFAHSIGGGGGDAGQASGIYAFPLPLTDRSKIYQQVSISVGGTAKASGSGGPVTVSHQGDIGTEGMGSAGIYAQSVGGGGGQGGTGAAGATGTVAIGGTGGAAGNGGDVSVDFKGGRIVTEGAGGDPADGIADDPFPKDPDSALDSSFGIFAQSVGGGGGHAGNATFFGIPKDEDMDALGGVTIGIGIGIDLKGGNSGDGGNVTVNSAGDILTYGPNAVGIFAQSVGGGGGLSGNLGLGTAGVSSFGTLLGSTGGNGSSKDIRITQSGSITTTGDGAHGIFAQSAGPHASGKIAIDVAGRISAAGDEAKGIFAQSVTSKTVDAHGQPTSLKGGGDITISLAKGALVSGGKSTEYGAGTGIRLEYGVENTITIASGATVTSQGAHKGYAIQSTSGTEAVLLSGTAIGSIDLGSGGDRLDLNSGGRLESGATLRSDRVNLMAGSTISPMGAQTIGTTRLTGVLSASGGAVEVTLDAAKGTADLLQVSDAVAMNGGTIAPVVIDIGSGGQQGRISVLTGPGDYFNISTMPKVTPSAVGQFSLAKTGSSVDLLYDIDFAAPLTMLGANNRRLALHLSDLHGQGLLDHGSFSHLLDAADAAGYGALLDRLSPVSYAATATANRQSAGMLAERLMSCRERDGTHRFVSEGECLRFDIFTQRHDRDRTAENPAWTLRTNGLAVGGQWAAGADYEIGASLSYEPYSVQGDGGLWRNEADQITLGATLKRQFGNTALAFALGAGFAEVEHERNIAPGVVARSTQDTRFVMGAAKLSHVFEQGNWYIRPGALLSAIRVSTDDARETGGGSAGLAIAGTDDTYVTITPSVEIGGEFKALDGTLYRPRVALGLTQALNSPDSSIDARFLGAPAGFTYVGEGSRTSVNLEAGIDVLSTRGFDGRINLLARFDGDSTSLGAFAGVNYRF